MILQLGECGFVVSRQATLRQHCSGVASHWSHLAERKVSVLTWSLKWSHRLLSVGAAVPPVMPGRDGAPHHRRPPPPPPRPRPRPRGRHPRRHHTAGVRSRRRSSRRIFAGTSCRRGSRSGSWRPSWAWEGHWWWRWRSGNSPCAAGSSLPTTSKEYRQS